jgi:aspartate aminotransferase
MKLSRRMQVVKPSATMAAVAEAAALRAAGVDVISFGAGEPDFDTPEHVKRAAREALDRGETKYTPVQGIAPLRQAIAEKLAAENDLPNYSPDDEICVGCGGKQVLFNAFLALLDPGDEVLVPAPYWVSYPDMIALAGARQVTVETRADQGFKMTAESLRRSIGSRTRAVVLNSPSNPAGVVYSSEELQALANVLAAHDVVVITDDIYEHFLYVSRPRHLGAIAPGLRDRLLVVNSLSKTYAMTGWRVGYAAGPAALIQAMVTLQGQSTSNPTSIAQAAAVAALRGGHRAVQEMAAEFARRRTLILDRITRIPGLSCVPPDGAFYAFADVSGFFGRRWSGGTIEGSGDFCRFLLAEGHVGAVAGAGFGSDAHVRFSFALAADRLQAGFDRIEAAVARLE